MQIIKQILSFLLLLILQISFANSFTSGFSNEELCVFSIENSEKPNSDFLEADFEENNTFEPSYYEFVSFPTISFCDGYPELIDAWKVLSEANVNDILRRNTDELKKISDDISEVKRLGYSNWKRIVNSTSKLKLKKLKGIKIDGNATAIGRMDALKKYDGYSNVDSWKKTGTKPGSTGEKVTWTENRKWLQDRIDRGDVFIMSIDPKTLPPVKGGFVPNQPNGYFTAREFDMLKKQGAKIILDY